MKLELKYIEQKTAFDGRFISYDGRGPAWIAWVKPTKSGKGFYFNGQRFGRSHQGESNYGAADENGRVNQYWVSGVKKQGDNRYPWGNQKIILQKSAVAEFLRIKGEDKVDSKVYEVVDFENNFEVPEVDENQDDEKLAEN